MRPYAAEGGGSWLCEGVVSSDLVGRLVERRGSTVSWREDSAEERDRADDFDVEVVEVLGQSRLECLDGIAQVGHRLALLFGSTGRQCSR